MRNVFAIVAAASLFYFASCEGQEGELLETDTTDTATVEEITAPEEDTASGTENMNE